MAFQDYEWLAAVVAAHPDKKVIGRTRLQKTIKLLQRMGVPTSYGFSIHYYGPYSEGVQSDIGLLDNLDLITEEEQSGAKGAYYIIQAADDYPMTLPDMSTFKGAIGKMADTDATVLELAATYDAFRELGANADEAMIRLKRKKGAKCDDGRAEAALTLLRDLKLLSEEKNSSLSCG